MADTVITGIQDTILLGMATVTAAAAAVADAADTDTTAGGIK